MNEMPAKLRARTARKTAKRDEKKRQIAESAIEALKELGYANTTLRDIADKSDLSLGMLHYYFEDRTDLIIYCVSIYKDVFVHSMTEAIERAEGRDQLVDAFAEALVHSIIDDKMTHRLWYDIRNQAMFDETFRPVVAEIEAKLIDLLASAFAKAGTAPPETAALHYALLDGVFRFVMQGQLGKAPSSRSELTELFRSLLRRVLLV